MNGVKNVLARVLAVWAMLFFIVTMFIAILCTWAISGYKEPKRSHIFQRIIQVWMTVFFTGVGVRRIFKGKEYFNNDETYIVVCNHNSLMDPPLSSPGIPEANKTIAKIEMARIPLFGVIYKTGSVLVDRKSDESRKQSYTKMKGVLAMGLHMCIYPEGTRNKTSEPLQRFHDGAFRLAVETGRPIMPSLIFHTRKVLPPGKSFYFWPHKVEMHFLQPIPVGNKSVQELKDEVFTIMKDYYVQHSY
jgi:1-acyl-sn-glycerol-3-phosphate acyltransferase